jgi:hypothetical protein
VFRLALATLLCCAPVGGARAWAAAKDPLAVEIARVDVDQAKQVEIVSQRKSADDRELTLVLKPKGEQFSIDLDLTGRDFQRVRIIVRGAKKSDVARYFTDIQRKVYIDLAKIPGVDIFRSGDDLTIDFTTPKAALVLPPEGRLLFREIFVPVDDKAKPAK